MTGLNVSLEPHLISTLKVVRKLLPKQLQDELAEYVADPPRSTIPHHVLQRVSEWARSQSGRDKLRAKSIQHQEYSMVSLLAGTMTSPEKSYGDYVPPPEPEVAAAKRASERKAITALVNSLFSIFGASFAAWWGADKTGWKHEYKVLFGLAVGIVVAISEGVLFLIWSSRTHSSGKKTRRALHKKDRDDGELVPVANVSVDEKPDGLRQRHI